MKAPATTLVEEAPMIVDMVGPSHGQPSFVGVTVSPGMLRYSGPAYVKTTPTLPTAPSAPLSQMGPAHVDFAKSRFTRPMTSVPEVPPIVSISDETTPYAAPTYPVFSSTFTKPITSYPTYLTPTSQPAALSYEPVWTPPQLTNPIPPRLPTFPQPVNSMPLMTPDMLMGPASLRRPSAPPCRVRSNDYASKDDIYLLCKTLSQSLHMPSIKIPKFKGDPKLFYPWLNAFDDYVTKVSTDASITLRQMIEHTEGEAREAIEHLVLSSDKAQALQIARDTLIFRFGNKSLVIDAHIRSLTVGPKFAQHDVKGICTLASDMRNAYVIFRSWGAELQLDSQFHLEAIFSRLPRSLRMDYVLDASWLQSPIPSFLHLLRFVEKRAYLYNTFYGRALAELDVRSKPAATARNTMKPFQSTKVGRITTFATVSKPAESTKNSSLSATTNETTTPRVPCPCCEGSHFLYLCVKFKDMEVDARLQWVNENKICRNCLRSNEHFAYDCTSNRRCQVTGCRRKHHTLLHVKEMPYSMKADQQTTASTAPSEE